MVNKRIVVLASFLVLVVVVFSLSFSLFITGNAAVNETGVVNIFISTPNATIRIYSPENNTVYDFDKGVPYIIDLNVSANFNVEAVDGWKYSLYDVRHGVWVETGTLFSPNSSVGAVRWENLLWVFAHQEDGDWINNSVSFNVSVPNSSPILGEINDSILVCEKGRLDYRFNATDVDEDDLVGSISPTNPFYVSLLRKSGYNVSLFSIISGQLHKKDVGLHSETISVKDPYDEVDSALTTIDVIEINNPVVMFGLGAQTVWLVGEDTNFYHQMYVEDVEGSDLVFNLSWGSGENLFGINSSTGIMNYSSSEEDLGIYSLRVCVRDEPIDDVHENISLCAPYSWEATVACDDFTLTVTDENRAPEIRNPDPLVEEVYEVVGTENASFYAEGYDKDGTIPDIDWYVDGVLIEHNENVSFDTFDYNFGCGVSGYHNVTVVASDGLLTDSSSWNVSVLFVACPVLIEGPAGGGGGSASIICLERWVCDSWNICQNVKRSFDAGILSLEDYLFSKEVCAQNGYSDERYCGFQITTCHDLNDCNRSVYRIDKPDEMQFCYYTENPNCEDGITNCHDGGCELLVDCGGPCSPCPTCSDGKQNQGEDGIDCGGPCPFMCEPEKPSNIFGTVLILLLIVLLLIIIYLSYRTIKLFAATDDDYECRKCGHTWAKTGKGKPSVCPKCKSLKWNE